MKIVHVSLCSYPFISSWGYQENYLIKAHHKAGHEVTEITTAYIPPNYREHIQLDEALLKREYIDEYGTKIIRLPYRHKYPIFLQYRIRIFKDFYKTLEKEKPDVLFIHDMQFMDLFKVKKYAKMHPKCLIKGDIHVAEVNSANNLVSKFILHRFFYKWIIRSNYKIFHTIYYIADGCKEFFQKYYGISDKDIHMEELLLGGEVFSDQERAKRRKIIRKKLGLSDSEVMLLHSGKLEKGKRTHDLLEAFLKIDDRNLKLYIIGSIPESQKKQLERDIKRDTRVTFLGWKSADEIRSYLCAADLYLQPGTQSSTLQTAICCGCPCILNFDQNTQGGGYCNILNKDQAYPVETIEDIRKAIELLANDREKRRKYAKNAMQVAIKKFDYDTQVKRIITK